MKYRPTILNVFAVLFLAGLLVHTILNYKTFSFTDRYDSITMLVWGGIAVILYFSDFLLQWLIKNSKVLNTISGIIVVAATIAISIWSIINL